MASITVQDQFCQASGYMNKGLDLLMTLLKHQETRIDTLEHEKRFLLDRMDKLEAKVASITRGLDTTPPPTTSQHGSPDFRIFEAATPSATHSTHVSPIKAPQPDRARQIAPPLSPPQPPADFDFSLSYPAGTIHPAYLFPQSVSYGPINPPDVPLLSYGPIGNLPGSANEEAGWAHSRPSQPPRPASASSTEVDDNDNVENIENQENSQRNSFEFTERAGPLRELATNSEKETWNADWKKAGKPGILNDFAIKMRHSRTILQPHVPRGRSRRMPSVPSTQTASDPFVSSKRSISALEADEDKRNCQTINLGHVAKKLFQDPPSSPSPQPSTHHKRSIRHAKH